MDNHKHNSDALFLSEGARAVAVSERAGDVRVGLVSDTHGLLRPQAVAALRGCDRIVHAGDIGDASILDTLARIAPVTAVRGNNDIGAWADALREEETLVIGETRIYVIHDVKAMTFDARARGIAVVVSGHSHRPIVRERDGVTYVNPGSAGPRRFSLPVAIGEVVISQGRAHARLTTLAV